MDVADIEKQVFKKLVSNPAVLAQHIAKISADDFTTPIIRSVMNAFTLNPSAAAHYVPSKNFFEILMRDTVHTPQELEQVANVLAGVAAIPADVKDLDMLVRELKANRMCREMTTAIQRHLPMIRPDTVDQAYEGLLKDMLRLPLHAVSGIDVAKLREVHDALEERTMHYLDAKPDRMSTTIKAFDAVMGGYGPEEFVIITAGVGQGKSYFMLWLAERMVEAGNNTLYVTIEMSYDATMARYNSIQTGFSAIDIADKRIPKAQLHNYFERLIAANKEKPAREAFLRECSTIKNRLDPAGALALSKKYKNRPAKMFIMDLPSMCTPTRVEQEIQRISMDHKLDCVFVDFINVMDPTFHNKDRARELANVSRELKVVARKTKVRLFSAAQLDTTSMEGTQDEVITTDHIKYAKAIGENADWVMAFFRTPEDNLKKQLRVQMAKTRGSAPVTALLEFDFNTSQAIDLGFADNSVVPHGYLKDGTRTADAFGETVPASEAVQEDLGTMLSPAPPQLGALSSSFGVKNVTKVEEEPFREEELPPF